VSAIEGESALTERVKRQRGNERLEGSEGVRDVRSRSDGGGGVRRGPRGPKGVQTVRSRSDGGNQTGMDEQLRVTLTGGQGVRCVCAKWYPWSKPFDLNQTEGIGPGK
jgi:hypothetical protein